MALPSLQNIFGKHPSSAEIIKLIQESEGNRIFYFKGLVGSGVSFLAGYLSSQLNKSMLLVLNDHEEAAYVFNDLENICKEKNILFFPATFKKPYQIEEVNNANILLRAEVLKKIKEKSSDDFVVVTYTRALVEKVVSKETLSKQTLQINKGEKLSIDFISEVLMQYRFEREDYVVEPGQYSVRGGIIDIFSYSNEYPFRIELFGDDVESIRSFDPVSQLSISSHDTAVIIPNIEDSLVESKRQSFISYLPDNSIVWMKDAERSITEVFSYYDDASNIFKNESESGKLIKQLPPEALFYSKESFIKDVSDKKCIEFGLTGYLKSDHVFNFNQSPQPAFNKQFDLLIENIRTNNSKGIQTYIFSDTEKQRERLESIFNDVGKNVNYSNINVSVHEGFIDNDLNTAFYTDHQLFERYHRFKLKNTFYKKKEALTLRELKELQPGDYVTHIDHGIGRFAGLEKIEINGKQQEAIRLMYRDNDLLYINISALHKISKYSGKDGATPKIDKLGSAAWQNLKQKTKKKVKEIAFDLIQLYAKRKASDGFAFSPDTYLQNELEASFFFEDTPDQVKATADVKSDMEKEYPMDRLICGDVGFGKTEIAIRAAFKAVCDSKQVAVLVPTTILAFQHYKTFSDRLKGLPCNIEYISRFKTAKEQKIILKNLKEGKIDILIGTHKLVSEKILFKDLGLLIIDEEQKFGVGVKDKLKTLKENVDTLTLTATPIPRTLQFSLLGARDLSIINTPPPNRYPIHTEVQVFNEALIRDAVMQELMRGGQVFFIHNKVASLPEIAGMISRLCPNAKVGIGHGQMQGDKLENCMLDFIEGNYDVLVSTTIVESGLDISNANTIIINDAQNFGLSDLHQMRGRVGRTNKKAFCYLLVPSFLTLTDEASKRLKAITQFSDLGSGFNIAMRDLDIRGAGDLLGAEQSGFISDIGYDMYQKILNEALSELKSELNNNPESQQSDSNHSDTSVNAFVSDCTIETDLEILIPDSYVSNTAERLTLYRELDELNTEEALLVFEKNLVDRFGAVPSQTQELMLALRLRWMAVKCAIEKIILKNSKLLCYFVSDNTSLFYQSKYFTNVISYVQKNKNTAKIKETNNRLLVTIENCNSISDALSVIDFFYR